LRANPDSKTLKGDGIGFNGESEDNRENRREREANAFVERKRKEAAKAAKAAGQHRP
jgi:hypothetical protein